MLRLKRNEFVKFSTIIKYIHLEDINYTCCDFINDYKQFYQSKSFISLKLRYLIYKKRMSIEEYAESKNIPHGSIYKFIDRKKMDYETLYHFYDLLELKFADEDMYKITPIIKDRFLKLISSKEELEKVKFKYNIPYPILRYKNELFHIALDGWIFEYLKSQA